MNGMTKAFLAASSVCTESLGVTDLSAPDLPDRLRTPRATRPQFELQLLPLWIAAMHPRRTRRQSKPTPQRERLSSRKEITARAPTTSRRLRAALLGRPLSIPRRRAAA